MLENQANRETDRNVGMKKRRIIKNKSRIPGVPVGDQVATSIGTKKKVCFNIGGRWFFRMVDPDWRAPGRPMKARDKAKGENPKGGEKK
jgi:ribosomal protein L32E